MFRDDQTSIVLRAAINGVIAAFNTGDRNFVREAGRAICQTYFADKIGYRNDADILDALLNMFRACNFEHEVQLVSDAINALPPPFILPAGDTHFLPYVESGGYQTIQREAAYRHIHEWNLALDVGAHVGFWSNSFARRFTTVHSFEPNPETFKCLMQNKFDNVTAHNFGLGEDSKNTFLSYPDGRGTREPHNSGGWEIVDEETEGAYPVMTRPMDSLGLRPDFIKIDVQGYELHVLKGGYETIMKYRPIILIELIQDGVVNQEAIEFIENELGMHRKEVVLKDYVYGWE